MNKALPPGQQKPPQSLTSVADEPLESDAVLWSIPISIARVDVESVADVFDPKNK
jgi:hypothetical protein